MKLAKKRYSLKDDAFLKENFKTMTSEAMGKEIGRTKKSVNFRLSIIGHECGISYKTSNQKQANGSAVLSLFKQGRASKTLLKQVKGQIKAGEYLKIMVGEKVENCLVEFVTDSLFIIKRRNYRECYNFVELMQGTVTILVQKSNNK